MSLRILKALDELYHTKETKVNFQNADFVKTVLIGYDRVIQGKSKLIATEKFKAFYEKNYKISYLKYSQFIQDNQLQELCLNFSLIDVEALIKIKTDKNEIIKSNLTFKQISSQYFSHSKYLIGKKNLITSVKLLLDNYEFPEDRKEQQYLSILHSTKQPTKIILCENDDRLYNPRQVDTEFWYAGGKNTAKLKFAPKPGMPLLYLCDWDYDGLSTYLHIKNNYFNNLEILIPSNYFELFKSIEETEHDSKWKGKAILLGFESSARKIIAELIEKDCWIEEESINLLKQVNKLPYSAIS